MDQVPAAMSYSVKALELSHHSGDKALFCRALTAVSSIYFDFDDYKSSSDYLFKSLSACKSSGSSQSLSNIYIMLARCFDGLNDYNKAVVYYHKALDLQGPNISPAKAAIYNNLSIDYLKQGDYTRALDCQGMHLKYSVHINDSIAISNSFLNFGYIYLEQGKLDASKDNLDRSLRVSEIIKDNNSIARARYMLGLYNMKKGDFRLAADFMQSSLSIYKSLNMPEKKLDIYNHLSYIYASAGDLRKALYYKDLSSEAGRKLADESNSRLLSAIRAKHSAEKDMLQLRTILAEKQGSFNLLLVSLLLIMLVLIISMVSYMIYLRKNMLLLAGNEKLGEYQSASEDIYRWMVDDFRNALACLAISIDSVSPGKNSIRLNNDYNRISKIYNHIITLIKNMKSRQ
jgi:tetratricopeptide (TPR) repeat protein